MMELRPLGSCGRIGVAGLLLLAVGCSRDAAAPDFGLPPRQQPLPAPILDLPPSSLEYFQTIVLAGGKFWTTELVFEHVRGVHDVVSGYVGGTEETADYFSVAVAGTTDHALAVEITFDPREVTLGRLLQVFFSSAHDPTQLNRQDPDYGRSFRSNIFFRSTEQREVAEAYIRQIEDGDFLPAPIATRVDSLETFFWAEEEQQDFAAKNQDHTYVQRYSLPKVLDLAGLFPDLYRASSRPLGAVTAESVPPRSGISTNLSRETGAGRDPSGTTLSRNGLGSREYQPSRVQARPARRARTPTTPAP